ncbi:phosphotransferase family protein [Reyranella massiliensis]|uniref:phosphotransferase family protein n=1 Tax=Reyranella massiliensis TaxID=445220 RepID=UPI0005C29F91|nr:aminoglycoside phosphotransferase family protein [Reyranella massiliensis]
MRAAIVGAFPEHESASFRLLTQGWDSVAVDVDDRLIFKFPRHEEARRRLVVEASVLDIVRSAVSLPVPHLTLHGMSSTLFSRHDKIAGEHLPTVQYEKLPEGDRQRLACDLALFYAELHRLPVNDMASAGATSIKAWLPPDEILQRTWPVLVGELRVYAKRTVAAWQDLPVDPHGTIYGFFDGHGWNMAFDHVHRRLNGLYDFGDSGFGPLHQEFIYSNLIAGDLTTRIVTAYEALTGRPLDRERVALLNNVWRLSELAELAHDPVHAAAALEAVAACARG